MLRPGIAVIATFLIGTLTAGAQNFDASGSSEYVIKAGFIYNFAKLVEWPGGPSTTSNQPIVISVLGDETVASILEHVVKDKTIESHSFVVKRLKSAKESKDCACQMLFITRTESGHIDEVLQLLKDASVLTIAETPGFTQKGGIINFVIEDNKVRFEVNVNLARQRGLSISSRLLSLAKVVAAYPPVR